MRTSLDRGKTWQEFDFGLFVNPLVFAQDQRDSSLLWASTYTSASTNEGDLFWSTDGGKNWQVRRYSPFGDADKLIAGARARGELYALVQGAPNYRTLWRTTDFGATWDTLGLAPDLLKDSTLLSDFVATSSPPYYWFAAEYYPFGVKIKYSDTSSWQYLGKDDTLPTNHLSWDDARKTLYAAGRTGVWKWQLPTAVREASELAPKTLALGPCFPNPTQGIANIPVRIAARERAQLTIYDALGRIVSPPRRIDTQGEWRMITLDMRGMPPGIYRYTLRTGSHIETREFSVVR